MTLNALLPNLPWLTNLAAKFTHNTAEAEDCAIIALERIEPRLKDFKTKAEVNAFLATTACNAAIDAYKADNRRHKWEKAAVGLMDYSDETIEAAIRLRLVIAYGIPQLEGKAREIAELWAQGWETQEIAGKLGLAKKTIRNQKGLIIRDLKRWVKRCKLQ